MQSNISLQQIEIFLTVAKYRNISKAARSLYISQPAVSKWLKDMESEIGKELFIRDNRGVSLSEYGETLYAELDSVYHRFRIMLDRIVTGGAERDENALMVGCLHEPHTIKAMLAFLDHFSRACPDIPAPNELYNFQELRDKLFLGELDLAFTMSWDVEDIPGLETIELREIEQYFIVPACWLADGRPDGADDILSDEYSVMDGRLLLAETQSSAEAAQKACLAHGFAPSGVKYAGQFLLIISIIARGGGFTVWGRQLPEPFSDRIRLIPFKESAGLDTVHVVAVTRKEDASRPVARAVEILADPQLPSQINALPEKASGYRW